MPELVLTGDLPGPEMWLHVRVDNKEGWAHEEEDFQALGLPPAD
jgi:hypothetical protein